MNQPPNALVAAISKACGRDVSLYDDVFLAQSLEKWLAAAGDESVAASLDRLTGDRAAAEAFCRALTIVYSEFFRNPLTFALLETLILPHLAQERGKSGRSELRVWSAGCAAGQEAYSIAILLDELAAARDDGTAYRIFASDLAEHELATARQGIYAAAAVQNVQVRRLHKYFTAHGEAFRISPQLRERVDFSRYDLLDAHSTCPPTSIYGDFDLIVCSNVLIYYRPAARQCILDKLRYCLAPDGYLVTGEAERAIVAQAGGFAPIAAPTAIFSTLKSARVAG